MERLFPIWALRRSFSGSNPDRRCLMSIYQESGFSSPEEPKAVEKYAYCGKHYTGEKRFPNQPPVTLCMSAEYQQFNVCATCTKGGIILHTFYLYMILDFTWPCYDKSTIFVET